MKILPVLTAALLLCSCAADRETEALKNSLSEAQTAVRLSAENTKRLEDTYSDIYFHLDSLTVESFKKRVANGDTVYAYIGRPSCGDCNAFEPMFKRYIASRNLNGKIYFVNVHRLYQDKEAWTAFRQQYKLGGTPVLAIQQRQTSQQTRFGRKRRQNQRRRLGEMAGRKQLAISCPFGIAPFEG